MTFEFSTTNLHLFGLDFPLLTWPLWIIVFAFLISGRAPGRVNRWMSGLVRREKDPIGYWIGIAPFIVAAVVFTAMFNDH